MAQVDGYQGQHQFGGMLEFERDLNGPALDYVAASDQVLETPQALIYVARYLESTQQ